MKIVHIIIVRISPKLKGTSNNFQFVTPAKAGVQLCQELMDSCFRRNDIFRGSLNSKNPNCKDYAIIL